MNLRTLLIALALLLLAVFALLNWSAFLTPTTLSLGFAEVQAPLGLVMLIVTGVVSALFLLYIVFQQASIILELRRTARELKTHRELADKAEASRFTEMRSFVESELRRLEAQGSAGTRELGERLERMDKRLDEQIAESTRTLSSYLGEVEDKLDRMLPSPPGS